MSNACLYFKILETEISSSIEHQIDQVFNNYKSDYNITKILVETDEFSQLDIFLNREIDNFKVLILCTPIIDEFYNLVFQELQKQGQLKVIQVD